MSEPRSVKKFKMWIAVGSCPAANVLGYTREDVVKKLRDGTRLTPVQVTIEYHLLKQKKAKKP